MNVADLTCPCGDAHEALLPLLAVLRDVPPTIPVTTLAGSWAVPRLYIAAHGLKGFEVPMLAARYGWARVWA